MINKLHDEHFHLMVSVWPYLPAGHQRRTTNSTRTAGSLRRRWSAAFILWGRRSMTRRIRTREANIGRTSTRRSIRRAWTPGGSIRMSRRPKAREDNILVDHKLRIGSGARYANIFPLFHTGGVSEGQQSASDKKRVFILSRSAYAGVAALRRDGVVGRCAQRLGDVCSGRFPRG